MHPTLIPHLSTTVRVAQKVYSRSPSQTTTRARSWMALLSLLGGVLLASFGFPTQSGVSLLLEFIGSNAELIWCKLRSTFKILSFKALSSLFSSIGLPFVCSNAFPFWFREDRLLPLLANPTWSSDCTCFVLRLDIVSCVFQKDVLLSPSLKKATARVTPEPCYYHLYLAHLARGAQYRSSSTECATTPLVDVNVGPKLLCLSLK